MPLTPKQRADIVHWALWGARNTPDIHYSMRDVRDNWLEKPRGHLPLTTDCSGFATACYKWAEAPDPSGFAYKKLGYTGSMLQHMRHIHWTKRKPGDLVVYGPGTGHHVCVLVEKKRLGDSLLVSHGQESGPSLILQSVERKFQPSPSTWLTLP